MADRTELTPKRPRGRPPADPAAGSRRKVSTWLTAPEVAWLEARYGSVYAGLQELVKRGIRRTPR